MKATGRAASLLGFNQGELASVIGTSASTISRLLNGGGLDPASKEGELATLFVRVFRSLDAMVGGDAIKARAWMQAHNHHLGGTPATLVRKVPGLVHVLEYLDAVRGKI